MSLFRIAEEMHFGTYKLWQTVSKSREQRKGAFFYIEKEGLGRGSLERKERSESLGHW